MTDSDHGTVGFTQDKAWVEFERVLEAPIDRVWTMISTDDGLGSWLAPSKVDLRVGGTMDIDFGEDGLAGGMIISLEPGSALEYHWQFPGETDSVIRFELTRLEDDRTLLRLHHRTIPGEQAVGYGAGWHAHIEALEKALADESGFDWNSRFMELLPLYQGAAAR